MGASILRGLSFAPLFLVTCLLSLPVHSFLNDAEAINKSGLQRMLSQRIAKGYLMIGLEVNPEEAIKQLDNSIALYEAQTLELMDYAPNREISKTLQLIASHWQSYRIMVLTQPEQANALKVIEDSDTLLKLNEKLVRQIEQYANHKAAHLINTAGRQRMLSQRIGKYYLAMAWKLPIPDLEARFNESVKEFEEGLDTLNASKLNNPQITAQLQKASSQWQFSKTGFKMNRLNQYVPTVISVTTESLLKKMNLITSEYEQLMPCSIIHPPDSAKRLSQAS